MYEPKAERYLFITSIIYSYVYESTNAESMQLIKALNSTRNC